MHMYFLMLLCNDRTFYVGNTCSSLCHSEEIRGEILFILYKLSVLEGTPWDSYDNNHVEVSLIETSQLLRLSLEVLLKTQHDEVRLNCIGILLTYSTDKALCL